MKILIVGASGATGRLLVRQLLDRGETVRAIVRSAEGLPGEVRNHEQLEVVVASLLDLSPDELQQQVAGCDAVASCLGHNLSWKGIFGRPRRLVTEAVRRLRLAVEQRESDAPVRFLLMNTTGNRDRDLGESRSAGERIVLFLLRLLLPPHADNEDAAEVLRSEVGQEHRRIGWVVVRPDGLTDETNESPCDIVESPVRSPIFNPGKTSRINVANFMARLATEDEPWKEWKGRMPVIYNRIEDDHQAGS